MEVFKLTEVLDNPLFDGFQLPEDAPSLLSNKHLRHDFDDLDGGKLSWTKRSLKAIWKPVDVEGPVRPFNDYPRIGLEIPVFSPRAVKALRDMLEENGELLPVNSKLGTYYIFNLLTKSDAFDVENAVANFGAGNGGKETAFSVARFAFDEDKLRGHSIFRIREYPQLVLVTDEFKRRAEAAGLNGLYFIKVWPFPEGVNWEVEEAKRRRQRQKEKGDLQGQCLIVKLKVSGKKTTAAEIGQATGIAKDFEKFLSRQKTQDEPYFGMVEDVQTLAREIRILLSGPDVDALADHLTPLTDSLNWPNRVEIVRRYGNMHDKKARETSDGVVSEGMKKTCLPVPPHITGSLHGTIETGNDILGFLTKSTDEIIAGIDELVCSGQKDIESLRKQYDNELIEGVLGALWGDQLVRTFGWKWIWIEFRNSKVHFHELGVVSPDESLVIYPVSYVMACFDDPELDCTIELSYNMLTEGTIPKFEPGTLENVMDGVTRLIPRD